MKVCVECQKTLGITEGYRHPTMGKDNLLCSHCFDIVFESVEKYREFITPYVGFFNKKSSTTNSIKHIFNTFILHERILNPNKPIFWGRKQRI